METRAPIRSIERLSMHRLGLVLALFAFASCAASDAPGPPESPAPEPASDGAPRFRYVKVVSFPGNVPVGAPWSPNRAILVFNQDSEPPSFRAMDLSEEGGSSWELLDARVQSVDWSPDGAWIAGEVVEDARTQKRTLIALPTARDAGAEREVEALAAGSGGVRYFWGRDGRVWYLPTSSTTGWIPVDPPDAWRRENAGPFSATPQFVVHDGPWIPDTPTFRVYLVEPSEAGIQERLLPMPPPVEGSMSLVDVFPDRQRLLVQIFPLGASPFAAVVDLEGSVQTLFDEGEQPVDGEASLAMIQTAFNPQSISPDGAIVIGTRTIEDGHSVRESVLTLGDANGRWVAPLEGAPAGAGPRFAHHDAIFVFANSETRQLEIGRFERIE